MKTITGKGEKRTMKKIALLFLILLYACLLENSICLADSAEVMPKGITRIDVEGKFYRDIDERYDSNEVQDQGHGQGRASYCLA